MFGYVQEETLKTKLSTVYDIVIPDRIVEILMVCFFGIKTNGKYKNE